MPLTAERWVGWELKLRRESENECSLTLTPHAHVPLIPLLIICCNFLQVFFLSHCGLFLLLFPFPLRSTEWLFFPLLLLSRACLCIFGGYIGFLAEQQFVVVVINFWRKGKPICPLGCLRLKIDSFYLLLFFFQIYLICWFPNLYLLKFVLFVLLWIVFMLVPCIYAKFLFLCFVYAFSTSTLL